MAAATLGRSPLDPTSAMAMVLFCGGQVGHGSTNSWLLGMVFLRFSWDLDKGAGMKTLQNVMPNDARGDQ